MNREDGLKAGIKAERTKRQIAELWIKHMSGNLSAEECDHLCVLIDESGLRSFQWGDAKSTKQGARVGIWYRDLADYSKATGCYDQIKQIEHLITDILFAVGIKGEAAQKELLQTCVSPRHQEAFWQFLKKYESIALAK